MVNDYGQLIADIGANTAKIRHDIPDVMRGFAAMAQAARNLGRPDATQRLLDLVKELTR